MPPENVPCPGCGLPMGVDEELCPHCRRPRDEREIERGKQDILDEEARRQRLPKLVALRLAVFFAAAALFFSRHLLYHAAAYLTHRGSAEIELYSDPEFISGRAPRATGPAMEVTALAPDARPSTAPAPPPSARVIFVAAHKAETAAPPAAPEQASPSAPADPPPPRRAVAPSPPSAPGAGQFLFYGVVFDMATAAPVAHARVVVRLEGREVDGSTYTDEDGFYKLAVSRRISANSFFFEVSAPGYREGQVEDRDPSWLEASDEARLAAMGELTGHDLDPVPRSPPDGDGLVSLDLLLLPAAGSGKAP